MNPVKFARWELECDPVFTRDIFGRLSTGPPETCACAHCRNFAAARNQVYPADVKRLFEVLGISMDREAEVYHTHRIAPGRHHYDGWFHFVGMIVRGSDAAKQIGTTSAWILIWKKSAPASGWDLLGELAYLRHHSRDSPLSNLSLMPRCRGSWPNQNLHVNYATQLFHRCRALVEAGFFFCRQLNLDDLLDSLCTEFYGYANVKAVDAVFAL
jgi:hypothetical protein